MKCEFLFIIKFTVILKTLLLLQMMHTIIKT